MNTTPTIRPDKLILDGTKLQWHAERVAAWQRGEKIAPITIDCALSSNCTYACKYCYGKLQCMDKGYLSREVVIQFLDDAAEMGVKAVSFVSDGESTCNPHLYEAIRYGHAKGLDMALGTNGYLLRDDELDSILPCLTYLRFNISSGTASGYSAIHGVAEKCYHTVVNTIKKAVAIKKARKLPVTIGLQMVLMPEFGNEIMPLAHLSRDLGVDYFVIKHCSDDEQGTLGVQYEAYKHLEPLLHEAEALSTDCFLVKAKWSKIMSGGKRCYSQCFGPQFILQISGTGLVAPCGMFFNEKYQRFHIGNIKDTSLKTLWQSSRWQEVMADIASTAFDARVDCGTLCLQHKVNELLWDIHVHQRALPSATGTEPQHKNFI